MEKIRMSELFFMVSKFLLPIVSIILMVNIIWWYLKYSATREKHLENKQEKVFIIKEKENISTEDQEDKQETVNAFGNRDWSDF